MEYLVAREALKHSIHLCRDNILHKLHYCIEQGKDDISSFLSIEHIIAIVRKDIPVDITPYKALYNILFVDITPYKAIYHILLNHALKKGHLETVKYILKKGYVYMYPCYMYPCYMFEIASRHGHLHVVKWLYEHEYKWPQRIEFGIFENGHLHVAIFLYEHGYKFDRLVMNCAAIHGHLHMVQWLYEHGYEVLLFTTDLACKYGHLHVVKWLYEHGYRCTSYGINDALKNEHIEVGKWVHEHEHPPYTICKSLQKKYRHIVQYVKSIL